MSEDKIPIDKFKAHTNNYTIVDVRNMSEINDKKIFENSISIPLGELRENVYKIPVNKPIVVHCASGYRSAAGSSILQSHLIGKARVYDFGEAIGQFE